MDTNESIRTNAPEEIIELGVASIETKGTLPPGNESMGRKVDLGITE
jgi:hypothetical protein